MNSRLKSGFSLVEVMMAAGILAVGFMLIMTLWPAGMKLTAISTERVVGKVVADEAFAKIRLYGLDMSSPYWPVYPPDPTDPPMSVVYRDVAGVGFDHDDYEETRYPSADGADIEKKYCWSALVRQVGPTSFQVTVFISRLIDGSAEYPAFDEVSVGWTSEQLPVPVPVSFERVFDSAGDVIPDEIEISGGEVLEAYVNRRGVTIVEDGTGGLMRVLERDEARLILAGDIADDLPGRFWVVPPKCKGAVAEPPEVGGRCPCISVFQRVIEF